MKKIVDNWIDEDKLKDAIAKREAAEKKAKTAVQQAEAVKNESGSGVGMPPVACRAALGGGPLSLSLPLSL